ncbi:NAD-dependent succinate-semialdehyde dehydrogenase [Halorientalis pallida]|uniref:NAD-dependent succinate-semialdehyde dehydrogenase n=1 Tax=Halorientalis pallida TaxID=2479928 RepID=A0A498L111_9EURY|nr:NAD-dependent succinate-semialdehyde dehydrogenase [Halorientalis pallida]RXK52009.1 NAD-dependent succinate-semialdehyde dehydrogenase [Halorientalis pallida]
MQTIDPTTEAQIDAFDRHDEGAVEDRLERASRGFETWRERPVTDREALLAGVSDVLEANEAEYAQLMTAEMGKPINQARAEVRKCARVCEYYAENAGTFLQDERVGIEPGAKTFVAYEPLGPVLAVMPWNYPFWQVFRFAAPALAAGNVCLLKHAPNVQGCADAIADIFEAAGFPEYAFQTLRVGDETVAEVIADDRVRAVTLTGSVAAGRAVASEAGAQLKKTVLELGGSDPFVVLDDADVDSAAAVGCQSRTYNSGQSCIAAKRFVVHTDVYDEFVDRLRAEMAGLTVGDPTDEETDVGPMARADLRDDLHDQVERSVAAGATVELGGEPLDRDGFFYQPTILTDVPTDAPAAAEELFGPVAAVFEVDSEAAAIDLANDTDYGLGATVWTNDRERGEAVAREIDAGCVFVNEFVTSHLELPFGGIKNSGYGRELSGEGIREFVNRKSVWVSDP